MGPNNKDGMPMEELFRKFLRENLRIKIEDKPDYYSGGTIYVRLFLNTEDGEEEICYDYYTYN